jgi:hypothetical protein
LLVREAAARSSGSDSFSMGVEYPPDAALMRRTRALRLFFSCTIRWHRGRRGLQEGSELEPSVEYSSRALDDTAAFSRRFRAEQR